MPSGPPVKTMVLPSHTGELLEAVAVGLVLTATLVVAGSLVQPLASVTVREYIPAIAVVALGMDGDCKLLENELGPDQE